MRGRAERDLPLLHHLEQRGLHLRRRAVDLVREQEVAEDGAELGVERVGARAVDARADDVRRDEVGSELHAPEGAAEHLGDGLDRQGLRKAGDALDQQVAAGQQADEHALEHLVLPGDDPANLVRGLLDRLALCVALGGRAQVRALRHAAAPLSASSWAGRAVGSGRARQLEDRAGVALLQTTDETSRVPVVARSGRDDHLVGVEDGERVGRGLRGVAGADAALGGNARAVELGEQPEQAVSGRGLGADPAGRPEAAPRRQRGRDDEHAAAVRGGCTNRLDEARRGLDVVDEDEDVTVRGCGIETHGASFVWGHHQGTARASDGLVRRLWNCCESSRPFSEPGSHGDFKVTVKSQCFLRRWVLR